MLLNGDTKNAGIWQLLLDMCVPHRRASYFSFNHIGIEQSHANSNHRKNKKNKSLHKRAISYFSFHHIGIEQSYANNNHRRNKKRCLHNKRASYCSFLRVWRSSRWDCPACSLVVAADPPPTLLSAPLILLLTTLGVMWCACGGRCATLPVHTSTHAYKVFPKGNQWNLLTRKYKYKRTSAT